MEEGLTELISKVHSQRMSKNPESVIQLRTVDDLRRCFSASPVRPTRTQPHVNHKKTPKAQGSFEHLHRMQKSFPRSPEHSIRNASPESSLEMPCRSQRCHLTKCRERKPRKEHITIGIGRTEVTRGVQYNACSFRGIPYWDIAMNRMNGDSVQISIASP